MPVYNCRVEGCEFQTDNVPNAIAAAQLTGHNSVHVVQPQVPAPAPAAVQRRGPKVDRPQLTDSINEVTWNAFMQDWNTFVRANHIEDIDKSIQLLSCCDGDLKGKVASICPDAYTKTAEELLVIVKRLAVIPVAVTVKRNELWSMRQNSGEPVRAFHSRVKGMADICKFLIPCNHQHDPAEDVMIDYSGEMVKHVILQGLYDEDIRREISCLSEVDNLTNNDLITRIEAKETAREATSTAASNASISQFKRNQKTKFPLHDKSEKKNEGKCSVCKKPIQLFRKLRHGQMNKKAFTECIECWKKIKESEKDENAEAAAIAFSITSIATPSKDAVEPTAPPLSSDTVEPVSPPLSSDTAEPISPPPSSDTAETMSPPLSSDTTESMSPPPSTDAAEPTSHPMSIDATEPTPPPESIDATEALVSSNDVAETVISNSLSHHIFQDGNWLDKPEPSCPIANISTISHHIFEDGNWVKKSAPSHPKVALVAHTSNNDYKHFGFQNPQVQNVLIDAIADSGAQCCVWGWKQCSEAGLTHEQLIPVRQQLNAVSSTSIRIYGAVVLRMCGQDDNTCAAIVYISPDVSGFYLSNEAMKQLFIVPPDFPSVGSATLNIDTLQDEICSCPKRTPPPGPPVKLPFEATPDNIPKMKEYILNRYASSTFNTCPHHPIPIIPGPPVSIHVDPSATPVCVNTPGQVPLNLNDGFEKGMKLDESSDAISKTKAKHDPQNGRKREPL